MKDKILVHRIWFVDKILNEDLENDNKFINDNLCETNNSNFNRISPTNLS